MTFVALYISHLFYRLPRLMLTIVKILRDLRRLGYRWSRQTLLARGHGKIIVVYLTDRGYRMLVENDPPLGNPWGMLVRNDQEWETFKNSVRA